MGLTKLHRQKCLSKNSLATEPSGTLTKQLFAGHVLPPKKVPQQQQWCDRRTLHWYRHNSAHFKDTPPWSPATLISLSVNGPSKLSKFRGFELRLKDGGCISRKHIVMHPIQTSACVKTSSLVLHLLSLSRPSIDAHQLWQAALCWQVHLWVVKKLYTKKRCHFHSQSPHPFLSRHPKLVYLLGLRSENPSKRRQRCHERSLCGRGYPCEHVYPCNVQ